MNGYQGSVTSGGGIGQIHVYDTQPGNSPTPIAPIQEAMMRQENAVGSLHKTITLLENRLACVCTPTPTNGSISGAEPPPPQSHHQRLLSLAAGIERADQRLSELMAQLQL
jgi:hypothetical protein